MSKQAVAGNLIRERCLKRIEKLDNKRARCSLFDAFNKGFAKLVVTILLSFVATSLSAKSLHLSWLDESSRAEGILVERSSNGGDYIEVADLDASLTEFLDEDVVEGVTYSYRLRAYNAFGYSEYTVSMQGEIYADSVDSDGTGINFGNPLVLRWLDSCDKEDGFLIERSDDGVRFEEIAQTGANVTNYTDADVRDGQEYYYRLRSFNAFGYSDYTAVGYALSEYPSVEEIVDQVVVSQNVGLPGLAAESIYDAESRAYLLYGSASGFGEYEDAVQFTQASVSGDFELTILVHSFATDGDEGQLGLMVRGGLEANAAHESIVWAGSGYIEHLSRPESGASVSATKQTMMEGPVYLKASREYGFVTLRYSSDGLVWTEVSGGAKLMTGTLQVGLAIGSETGGRLSSGLVEIVHSNIGAFARQSSAWPYLLGEPLEAGVIGEKDKDGSHSYDSNTGVHKIVSSTVGYESINDELRFVSVPAFGDFDISVKLSGYKPDATWARAGLMVRSTLEQDSAHLSMLVRGDGMFESLYRLQDGSALKGTRGRAAPSVAYLRIQKVGDLLTGYSSEDGESWTKVTSQSIPLGEEFLVGYSIGSQGDGRFSRCDIELVSETGDAFAKVEDQGPHPYALSSFVTQDSIVGSMSEVGESYYDVESGLYYFSASGLGYEKYEDELRYTWVPVDGDFSLRVRLHDYQADATWSRAGLMLRESLSPDSKHASVTVNGDGLVEAIYRLAPGGSLSGVRGSSSMEDPALRLDRIGNEVSMYESADGENWTLIKSIEVEFAQGSMVGLAIGSQNDGNLSSVVVEQIDFQMGESVQASEPEAPQPFTLLDQIAVSDVIGEMIDVGEELFDAESGLYYYSASGLGHEKYEDELRYTWVPASGDFSLKIRVHDYEADASWGRTGLMLRETLNPDSKHVSVTMNGDGLLEASYRLAQGGSFSGVRGGYAGEVHCLRLDRSGRRISMYHSANGENWTLIRSLDLDFAGGGMIGLTIGSQSDGNLSSAVIEVLD
ncbi:fibronectin type III domain-containing protein [Pelagicoccus albus]|uniref:Fibronectin type III domain-containing protein n=1 Tax=Pelagicoccus albus TaxID=415222 RepID=A0A7X1B6J3_9BACT|nr:fibronectin type III domain-containing protein [Pelagicoccus albus]MBC2606550.1 fibronectin type III domain-containing protein [Pelagicoccus albus]